MRPDNGPSLTPEQTMELFAAVLANAESLAAEAQLILDAQRAPRAYALGHLAHEELANLAAYLLSGQAEYVNGECVVIDGGLWLRGAGEFNDFVDLPDAAWDMLEQARKK